MTKLVLSFTPPPCSELIATSFCHDRVGGEIRARLGAYDRCFKWSAGVRALSLLLLRTAAWNRNGRGENSQPCLEGRRPSVAASLNDVLTSQPRWTEDVFGIMNGSSVLTTLIGRWNADFKTSANAPVRIWLECDKLPPNAIQVMVGGHQVQEANQLMELAEDVARQCNIVKTSDAPTGSGPLVREAVPVANSGAVGVRLNVGLETILIEIELDRDFVTFSQVEEEQLLQAVRSLLKTSKEIPVKGKRPGSVIITLELTPDEAKELAAAVANGALAEHRAVSIRVVGNGENSVTGKSATQHTPTRHAPDGEIPRHTHPNEFSAAATVAAIHDSGLISTARDSFLPTTITPKTRTLRRKLVLPMSLAVCVAVAFAGLAFRRDSQQRSTAYLQAVASAEKNANKPAAELIRHDGSQLWRDLSDGKSVTIVGPTGPPVYSRFVMKPISSSSSSVDGAFTFRAGHYSLIELCPAPPISSYIVTMELRRESIDSSPVAEEISVGMYFGYSADRIDDHSVVHSMYAVNLAKSLLYFPSVRDSAQVGQKQMTLRRQHILLHDGDPSNPGYSYNLFSTPGQRKPIPGEWCSMRLDVSPNGLRVDWLDKQGAWVELASRSDVLAAQECAQYKARFEGLRPANFIPTWHPRMPFGVIASNAVVAIRNVVITPRP